LRVFSAGELDLATGVLPLRESLNGERWRKVMSSIRDIDGGIFDKGAPLATRAQRPTAVFAAVVRELAASRREAAALRRENDKLRTQLTIIGADSPQPAARLTPSAPDRQGHLVPPEAVWCQQCGLTVHAAAAQHDRTLILAECCPRCDGPLVPREAGSKVQPPPHPSIHLG
jgi:hypothetical protein